MLFFFHKMLQHRIGRGADHRKSIDHLTADPALCIFLIKLFSMRSRLLIPDLQKLSFKDVSAHLLSHFQNSCHLIISIFLVKKSGCCRCDPHGKKDPFVRIHAPGRAKHLLLCQNPDGSYFCKKELRILCPANSFFVHLPHVRNNRAGTFFKCVMIHILMGSGIIKIHKPGFWRRINFPQKRMLHIQLRFFSFSFPYICAAHFPHSYACSI